MMSHLGNVEKLELVEWLDSRQPTAGWSWLSDMKQTVCRCVSVGYVVQDDQDVLALAPNMADAEGEAQAMGVITIPRIAVLRRTKLTSGCEPALARKRRRS